MLRRLEKSMSGNSRRSVSSARRSISSRGSSSPDACGDGGGGWRICEWGDLDDDFRYDAREDEIASVVAKISKIYDRARRGIRDSWNGCSCVGLLDPVSNIIFNYTIAIFLKLPVDGAAQETEDMAQRSLDGLIAFLTSLFPCLPDAEALSYIDAAAADPLVAALLVLKRRTLTIESFITPASVQVALKCAAVAAKNLDPDGFVQGWKQAALCVEKLATQLKPSNRFYFSVMNFFSQLLRGASADFQLEASWKLANDRLPSPSGRLLKGLPSARGAIKRILLSMIHGYYIKALALLPKQELTDCYHRSLLTGGHCYGPLDPVSNILLNTIWYEQNFPAAKVEPLSMISTDCLWRIAARSLYGLVSFLCTRNKYRTPDQALQLLLAVRANLTLADPRELKDLDKKAGSRGGTVLEAYYAAAKAAQHPSASLQKDFLGTPSSVCNLHVMSTMMCVSDGCTLTKEKINCLTLLIKSLSSVGMPCPQYELQPTMGICPPNKCTFWAQHERVTSKVEAALHNFNKTSVNKYSLHIICGANELVEMECSLNPARRPYNPRAPYTYNYSHINFIATCVGSAPNLFFAECSNYDTSTAWCVPILLHPDVGISVEAGTAVGMRPEAARCIYCEHELGRIVHPIMEKFHGRDDFEKIYGDYYSNNKALMGCEVDWVHNVTDDYIYSS